ncbi:MAG: hypothetical protein C7B44_01210 [Sulfobacillus thermosulfidooxidans]|uniref:DUF3311 domain-containing protein n=1 Tax=Sulfobacillus thermotolerans TaxID=338644 RepID=A0ABM6RV76_9FIRM|nr:hypothetical protein [Sulfobacillus sp. hq2]AUW95133.1 hypothetical protein BXT84_15205 [Sulfobacillus thermotolerans]MCY0909061.1 hypothetical protein [Sulfobacillus thermotolerans]POB10256.1 hypothetical protein CO251_09855 [Sulfobacillus sp. hq2]PSR37934.1 MAG: hypothetical protein C7B44_01210 [Sulfobacillus thermosulfidooxidans]
MRTAMRNWLIGVGLVTGLYLLGPVIYFNRVYPFILGMPAILFWYALVPVLTPIILGVVYLLDPVQHFKGDD